MTPANRLLLGTAALLSGAAALVYQVLWVRTLGELFGSTVWAVSTVLAVFFLGLGAGGWFFGRVADRRRGGVALIVALELVIALCGAAFPSVASGVERLYDGLAPAEWSPGRALLLKAPLAAGLLLLPTLAMGGTLPALVRHVVARSDELGGRLGWVYGANTLGAALGVALAVLVTIPSLGMQGSAWTGAGLNLLAAGCAFVGRVRRTEGAASEAPAPVAAQAPTARSLVPRVATGLCGLLSVGLEVLWTRALAARFLSTVHSFATILFAFLLCLGAGAWIASALDRRGLATRRGATWILLLAGAAALASVPLLAGMPPVRVDAGTSVLGAHGRELLRAVLVMCVPVLGFGVLFPLLCRLAHREAHAVGRELGAMLLANTVGAVVAPPLFGFVLLPLIGLRLALLLAGALAIGVALALLGPWAGGSERERQARLGVATTAFVLALVLGRGDVRLWSDAPGDRLLAYREGAAASIAVVQKADGTRALKVDHSYRLGDTRTVFATRRQGLIPLRLHGAARSALFIGMGTGTPAGVAAAAGIERVDVLEIVPGLGELLPWFDATNEGLAARLASPRVRLLEVDGRHFVRTSERRYDVVVGDLFIPWRAGEGAMYTREHFEAVATRLAPDGLFVQWLPLYQLDPADLRVIALTFCAVFPSVEAFWLYFNVEQPALGLVGSRDAFRAERVPFAAHGAEEAALLGRAGLTEGAELLGSWIAGRDELLAWCGDAALETRDRPRIEFAAARHRVERDRPPSEANLVQLLDLMDATRDERLLAGLAPDRRNATRGYRRSIGSWFRASLARRAGDDEAALELLAAALASTPSWEWIALNVESLVAEAARAGELELAERGARALVGSEPFAARGHFQLALLRRAAGDPTGAREHLERALAIDPGHEPSRRLQAELGR